MQSVSDEVDSFNSSDKPSDESDELDRIVAKRGAVGEYMRLCPMNWPGKVASRNVCVNQMTTRRRNLSDWKLNTW